MEYVPIIQSDNADHPVSVLPRLVDLGSVAINACPTAQACAGCFLPGNLPLEWQGQ
ncbi:MAG: hypothetical protein KDK04_03410 [Candidatus Competibacteraceae bacterium]|nr:hypothetical protein [Candidatus Competibacteraceae bacterium]